MPNVFPKSHIVQYGGMRQVYDPPSVLTSDVEYRKRQMRAMRKKRKQQEIKQKT